MGYCAKCGKNLSWADEHQPWNRIKNGYINESDANFKGLSHVATSFPEFNGKKLCISCIMILRSSTSLQPSTGKSNVLSIEVQRIILWQTNEIPISQIKGKEFFEDKTVTLGARVGHDGFLVLTNQRLLFACKLGMLAKEYAVMYAINLESIANISHGRFGFNDKIVVLEVNNQHRDFIEPNIQRIIPTINATIAERKNYVLTEKQKQQIQIVLDFSSLKDIMSKGGLVMTTYKCPNCNGMVKLPEEGKVLMCEYCGTPIKPVDIFEKIKSLIVTSPITNVTSQQTRSIPIKEEIPFDLRGLKERLEKVFPTMVMLSEEERVIWVMGKVKLTEQGVVVGSGPAAKRCEMITKRI